MLSKDGTQRNEDQETSALTCQDRHSDLGSIEFGIAKRPHQPLGLALGGRLQKELDFCLAFRVLCTLSGYPMG
jgi:hypothetical protein